MLDKQNELVVLCQLLASVMYEYNKQLTEHSLYAAPYCHDRLLVATRRHMSR